MMKITVETLSVAETAAVLRAKLGPMRSWGAFLNRINAGGGSHVHGLRLVPCCQVHDGIRYRPRYGLSDVQGFIVDVLAVIPRAGPRKLEIMELEIEAGLHWSLNKFDKAGKPVPRPTPPGIKYTTARPVSCT